MNFNYTNECILAVRLNNYTLSINPSMGKRDLSRLTSDTNMTFDQAQGVMNASIQYAVSSSEYSSARTQRLHPLVGTTIASR